MREDNNESVVRPVSRRRMLRGAGAVVAGAAGATVAGAVAATPALAADGGAILQGQANAATAKTGLSNNTLGNATLELANAATSGTNPTRVGATLRLTPAGDLISDTAQPGSLSVTNDGTLWLVPGLINGQPYREYIYSSGNANVLVPLVPQRVVDTRNPGLRAAIRNPGALDGAGRVPGGQTIHIDLSNYCFNSYAIYCNLTATGQVADGFLTLYPYGVAQPATSNVNYAASQFALSNFALSGTGRYTVSPGVVDDAVSVFSSATSHVILDLVAVSAPAWGNVNPAFFGVAPTGNTLQAAGQPPKASAPGWAKTRT